MRQLHPVLQRVDLPTRGEIESAAVGGLVGGVASGTILQLGTETLGQTAAAFGLGDSLAGGWAAYLLLSLAFGCAFAVVVARLIEHYVVALLTWTNRWNALHRLVTPLVDRFGLQVVGASSLGVLYGLFVGCVTVFLLIPARVTPDQSVQTGVAFVGFTVYGLLLGATYGKRVVD